MDDIQSFIRVSREQFTPWTLPAFTGYSKDPELRYLYENPVAKKSVLLSCTIIFLLVPFPAFFLVSAVEGTLFMDDGGTGLFQDIYFISSLACLAVIFYMLHRVLGKIYPTFYTLQSVVDKKKVTREKYVGTLKKLRDIIEARGGYRKYKMVIVSVGFAFFVWSAVAHYFYIGYAFDAWSFGRHLLGYVVRLVFEGVIYMVFMPTFIYKLLSTMYAMNLFCKEIGTDNFKLRAMSPDKAGGLGPLGDLALNLEYLLLPIVFIGVLYLFVTGITILFFPPFVGLLLLLVITFMYPLMSAHGTMKDSRKTTLQKIEKEFYYHYDYLIHRIDSSGPTFDEQTERSVEGIRRLRYLYEETEKMPVWPFDITILSRFSATLLIPIGLVLFQEIILRYVLG